jgi:hypothetical protein
MAVFVRVEQARENHDRAQAHQSLDDLHRKVADDGAPEHENLVAGRAIRRKHAHCDPVGRTFRTGEASRPQPVAFQR